MSIDSSAVLAHEARSPNPSRLYYGWINVAVAAIAMVATLPGRTQGLGLITEPLLRDLHLGAVAYAQLNVWATLIGSAFCLGCGPLIDRFGARLVLTGVLAALGATVLAMSYVHSAAWLLLALILTRGFGQSALSVVSLTIVGKWFVRRLPTAMAVYSFLVGVGFVGAFPGVGYAVMHSGWRPVWSAIGWALLIGLAPMAWALVRRTPESIGLRPDGSNDPCPAPQSWPTSGTGFSLSEALATPAFWTFSLSATAFGLVSSGLMLFNEAVLRERGVDSNTVLIVLGVITFTALLANFLGGWLADRWPIGHLMGAGMFLLAGALLALPLAHGRLLVHAYAVAMGLAAGIVTVVFFVCWGRVFGRKHLGAIQGAAQLLTVLGSAAGPWLLAKCVSLTGSSTPILFALAPVVALLGVACLLTPLPNGARRSMG